MMRVHWASADDQWTACGKLALNDDTSRRLETDIRENQINCKTCLRLFAKRGEQSL